MIPVDPIHLWRAAAPAPEARRPALACAPQRGGETDSPARGASGGSVVRLSAGTKASAALRRAIEAVPEIQPGRVAALRAAVDAGCYDLDPDKIAARMVAAVL